MYNKYPIKICIVKYKMGELNPFVYHISLSKVDQMNDLNNQIAGLVNRSLEGESFPRFERSIRFKVSAG
jgi:hypothetical protein